MPLLKLFVEICLFRKGPQDLPNSPLLFKLGLAAFALTDIVLGLLQNSGLMAIPQALLEIVVLVVFVWITLFSAGKLNRLPQTLTAILGAATLINLIAAPPVALVMAFPNLTPIHLLLLGLLLWQTGVIAHILRHALTQTLAIAAGLAIVYTILSYQLVLMLFGPGGA